MARTKKQVKVKEPVRLRFNELKDGRKSIYLDIYYNGRRTYQSLKLYLVPETDVSAQIQNANTLAIANAIKTEKILDLTNKIAGITDRSYKANMLFTDWMRVYRQDVEKRASASALIWVDRVTNELEKYDNSVTLAEIDRDYIMRFLSHLLDRPALTRDHNQLAKNTVFLYLSYIRAALNYAVKENLLQSSPFKKIKRDMLSGSEAKREYLTVEEVKRLIATPCRRDDMKAAFLFSCFCGLRLSDVRALQWKKIIEDNGNIHMELRQKKTGRMLYLPLNKQAQAYLPHTKRSAEDYVFSLPCTSTIDLQLKKWAQNAGINKKLTYHMSRHTFATMELTMGADLYTTSQLLGHADVETTQVYAKIIDAKKEAAV